MIDKVSERVELYKGKAYMRLGELSRDKLLQEEKLAAINKELEAVKGVLIAIAEVKGYIKEVKTQFE